MSVGRSKSLGTISSGGTTGGGVVVELDGGFVNVVYLTEQDTDGGFANSEYFSSQEFDGGNA